MPEPVTRVGTFEETRHVGDDEASVAAEGDDPEIRYECRERVVGNLGPRRRYPRDQR